MSIEQSCGCGLPPSDQVIDTAFDEIVALVASDIRPGTSFALSILDSGTGAVGLFTGRIERGPDRRLLPEVVFTAPSEGEAFASCWRAPSVSIAARVSGLLLEFGPPGIDLRIVEIKAGGAS